MKSPAATGLGKMNERPGLTARLDPRKRRIAPTRTKFGRFLIVSANSFLLQLVLTALLHEALGVEPARAYALVIVLVFLMNFILLRTWVYRETRGENPLGRQFSSTVLLSVAFRTTEYLLFLLLHLLLGIHYLAGVALAMMISFVLKFLGFHYLVFGKKREE